MFNNNKSSFTIIRLVRICVFHYICARIDSLLGCARNAEERGKSGWVG